MAREKKSLGAFFRSALPWKSGNIFFHDDLFFYHALWGETDGHSHDVQKKSVM